MQKNEEPGLIEQTLLLVATCAAVYGFAVLMLSLEHKNAPQAPAATGKGSSPSSSSSGQPVALLSHPLHYSATVQDCTPSGRLCSRVRYYIPKEKSNAEFRQ
jgi:hypothetical protein